MSVAASSLKRVCSCFKCHTCPKLSKSVLHLSLTASSYTCYSVSRDTCNTLSRATLLSHLRVVLAAQAGGVPREDEGRHRDLPQDEAQAGAEGEGEGEEGGQQHGSSGSSGSSQL